MSGLVQGKIPRIVIPGKMVGPDENQAATNNSFEYRGRPYTQAGVIEQSAIDFNKEKSKASWQRGLKVVALYMTTGTIIPGR